jgi:hypothetical protein
MDSAASPKDRARTPYVRRGESEQGRPIRGIHVVLGSALAVSSRKRHAPMALHLISGVHMLLIREVMYCKPGKVRPLVEKFAAMSKLMEKQGMGKMRVMTDVAADRYWTVVSEFEVANLDAFEKMMVAAPADPKAAKEMEAIMQGYHDLVDHGRREIYKLEG